MSFKALGIGLPKTGTTTLCKAFREAGYIAIHHSAGYRLPPAGALMVDAWEEGLPMHHYLEGVEIVTQLDSAGKNKHAWPQFDLLFLKAFLEQYSGAYLILHTREQKQTIPSLKRWGLLTDKVADVTSGINTGSTDLDIGAWMESYYISIALNIPEERVIRIRIEEDARPILSKAFGQEFPWWGVANAYTD